MKTLDQRRASHGWKVVEQVAGKAGKDWTEFETQAKKLPTRIMASGLGQALAFLEAKKYAPALGKALADWINERRPVNPGENSNLMARVIQGDVDFLRFATAECLVYLQWLVRFADARSEG